jgi:FkbM family methyltransferase
VTDSLPKAAPPQRAKLNLTLGTSTRAFEFRPGTSDEGVIENILKRSEYNFGRLPRGPHLNEFYRSAVASGKTPLIVDAGANIGASAVYFAYSFPQARVVAIEPEKSNFELLSANTAGANVECIHAALAATAGRARVIDSGKGHWGFRTERGAGASGGESVECVTLNDIYRDQPAGVVPFIAKIDIEGGESELFSAGTEWVAETPVIVIELHDWLLLGQANSRAFLQCVSAHDRDFLYLGENVFSIDNKLVGSGKLAR